jgi:FtsP/CotA-like multicopper oxidase with cupredoxin domain
VWGFNGKAFDLAAAREQALPVMAGDRVKLEFANTTTMFHPVHLHGHTFAVDRVNGPRKDPAIVLPGQTLSAIFDADNPGL